MIAPGDILITLRTIGPLRRGDVVTVASTCADGEYLYLDGHGPQAFRAEYFLVAVRRPWWAWAEPGWSEQARAAAERFVREGIVVEAPAACESCGHPPHPGEWCDHGFGAWGMCWCGFDDLTKAARARVLAAGAVPPDPAASPPPAALSTETDATPTKSKED